MELLILTFILVGAMATVDLPSSRETGEKLVPVKIKKTRRSRLT